MLATDGAHRHGAGAPRSKASRNDVRCDADCLLRLQAACHPTRYPLCENANKRAPSLFILFIYLIYVIYISYIFIIYI